MIISCAVCNLKFFQEFIFGQQFFSFDLSCQVTVCTTILPRYSKQLSVIDSSIIIIVIIVIILFRTDTLPCWTNSVHRPLRGGHQKQLPPRVSDRDGVPTGILHKHWDRRRELIWLGISCFGTQAEGADPGYDSRHWRGTAVDQARSQVTGRLDLAETT